MDMRPMTSADKAAYPASMAPEGREPMITEVTLIPRNAYEPTYALKAILDISELTGKPRFSLILMGDVRMGVDGQLYGWRNPDGADIIGEWYRDLDSGLWDDARDWVRQCLPSHGTMMEASLASYGLSWDPAYRDPK